MAVIVPIVHLNGDRKETLMDQLASVYAALRDAEDVLRDAAPNARNYYLVEGLFEQAVTQHRARQVQLDAIIQSVDAEMIALNETYPHAR
jgi:hypothetical protein